MHRNQAGGQRKGKPSRFLGTTISSMSSSALSGHAKYSVSTQSSGSAMVGFTQDSVGFRTYADLQYDDRPVLKQLRQPGWTDGGPWHAERSDAKLRPCPYLDAYDDFADLC